MLYIKCATQGENEMTLKKNKDLKSKVEKIVRTVIDITEEQEHFGRYSYILRHLPIDSLDAVRSALKNNLGEEYKKVYIKYRGPRPNTPRLPATEENLLKIIALGKDAYRTEAQRASMCLKHDATHYSIYRQYEF